MLRMFAALMDGMLRIVVPPPRLRWEKDPWLYRAFYYAVSYMFSRFRPEGEEKLPANWRDIIGGLTDTPTDKALKHITQSPEAMGSFAEENMSRMFLEPALVRNAVSAIRASSGLELPAKLANEEIASRYEELDYVLSHARRIMKWHNDDEGSKS
jgi:hypothetical protein